jgi:hypothetical protein
LVKDGKIEGYLVCKSKAEGGGRCDYADMIANVRKKARYKYRDSPSRRERKVTEAVNAWKDAHPEIVKAHLPEKMPFQYTPKDRPVPKELLTMLTPSSRVPVTGASTPEDRLQAVIKMHEEFTEWENRLELDERRAVGSYTMSAFEKMNTFLRKKGFNHKLREDYSYKISQEEFDRVRDRTKEQVDALKSAFKKVTSKEEPRKLYRFFRVPAGVTPKEYVERYLQTGEGFSDPAFMSTTSDPEFIMAHMHDRNKGTKNKAYVVMEILTKQGQSVQPQPYTRSGHVQSLENEVLLPAGTKLRVVGFNPVQRFEYGSDRRDLHGQYNIASDSYFMFKNYGHHSQGDRLNFPMIQVIDEKLITEYEKAEQKRLK